MRQTQFPSQFVKDLLWDHVQRGASRTCLGYVFDFADVVLIYPASTSARAQKMCPLAKVVQPVEFYSHVPQQIMARIRNVAQSRILGQEIDNVLLEFVGAVWRKEELVCELIDGQLHGD